MEKNNKNNKDISKTGLTLLLLGISFYAVFNLFSLKSGNTSVIGFDNFGNDSSIKSSEKLVFLDVGETHKDAEAISYFKSMGFVTGHDDGYFRPFDFVSRAEFLKILFESMKINFSGGVYEKCFTDVQSDWFETYVCYASDKKLIKGYDDGSFMPEQGITRAEALKVIFDALRINVSKTVEQRPYPDITIDNWFAPYAQTAKELKIVTTRNFLPNLTLTRSSAVRLIYDTFKSTGRIKETSQ